MRKHCLGAGQRSLLKLSRSKLHRILTKGQVKPHKIRYNVERRDPDFERKMIEVLHVYKEVEIVNAGLLSGTLKEPTTVTIVSAGIKHPQFCRFCRSAPPSVWVGTR